MGIEKVRLHPRFIAALEETQKLADGIGMGIDEGIREAVASFRAAGLVTTASCEGHLDHGLPYPWIDFGVERPAVKWDDKELPAPAVRLREMIARFAEEYPVLRVNGFVANEARGAGGYRVSVSKSPGQEIRAHNLAEMDYGPEDRETASAQTAELLRYLQRYSKDNHLDWYRQIRLDIRADGWCRMVPASADNAEITAEDPEELMRKQRQTITDFAVYVFADRVSTPA